MGLHPESTQMNDEKTRTAPATAGNDAAQHMQRKAIRLDIDQHIAQLMTLASAASVDVQRSILSDLAKLARTIASNRSHIACRLPDEPVLIEAKAYSDDRLYEVEFDAAPWFKDASADAIITLANNGWGDCETADDIALRIEDANPAVQSMLNYCRATQRSRRSVGFVCRVDPEQAMQWLKSNRKSIWARIICEDNDIELFQAQEPEVAGRWDWRDANSNASEMSFETADEAAIAAADFAEYN